MVVCQINVLKVLNYSLNASLLCVMAYLLAGILLMFKLRYSSCVFFQATALMLGFKSGDIGVPHSDVRES